MEKVKKVCLISPKAPPIGGIARWTDLLLDVVNKDSEIKLTFINISPKKSTAKNRNMFDRVVVSGLDMFRVVFKLKKLLLREEIDSIHLTTSGSLALIRDFLILKIANKNKVKLIYHIHYGRIPELYINNKLEYKIISKIIRYADDIIVLDELSLKTIHDNIKQEHVYIIPNPINISNLNKIKILTNKEVCFVGWVIKTKGIEELLSAWDKMKLKEYGWKLNIVGPYNENYYNFLKEEYSLKSVSFTGEVTHQRVLKELSRCEIFILPSYTEGFPNVILEAMALKKAIIATNVGGISEMLSEESGICIESRSVIEIENALNKLVNDDELRKNIAKKGYIKCNKKYSLETIYKKYKELW